MPGPQRGEKDRFRELESWLADSYTDLVPGDNFAASVMYTSTAQDKKLPSQEQLGWAENRRQPALPTDYR